MDESAPSIFFSIRGYLTPTVLFLLLNLVIATIVLTSKTRQNHEPEPNPRPGPTGLERLRSTGLFRFGSPDLPRPEPDNGDAYAQIHHQNPPSALERVRSINLFRFGSRDLPRPEPDNGHAYDQIHHQNPPSALERVRSINLFRFGSRDLPPPDAQQTDPEPEHYDMDHHFRRIQSESAAACPKPVMAEEGGKLRKLASALSWRATEPEIVRRRPAAPSRNEEEAAAAEEEVDARADDFINRFRRQLHLQRLDSIMRYKDMLTRGN